MTYTDPIPANYNDSSISVDPGGLNSCADAINTQIQDIANALTNINNALSGLTLSWVGQAADSASTYNTEWTNAVQALFGTQNDASTGALNILLSGLSSAAQNYSANEAAIEKMFNEYANGFSASSSSSSSSGKPILDSPSNPAGGNGEDMYHLTSVNEL